MASPPQQPHCSANSPPPPPPPPPLPTTNRTAPVPPKFEETTHNVSAIAVDGKPHHLTHFGILNSVEYMNKYRKFEDEYSRRLMAKYFSEKNIYGGKIYDEKIAIGDEIIMSSRRPFTQTYADPLKSFQDQKHTGSLSTSES